jgi:TPR repeat protein
VLPKQEPTPAPTPASAPASSPGPSPAASTPPAAPPPPPPPKAAHSAAPPAVDVAARRRDDQIKAAEVALQSGNTAAAIDLLTPLADAGIAHAQFQLGRALEARSGRIPSNRAYMWFSLAARQGEPGAAAARDREAARLLPADVLQADRLIDHWKPHAPSDSGPPR